MTAGLGAQGQKINSLSTCVCVDERRRVARSESGRRFPRAKSRGSILSCIQQRLVPLTDLTLNSFCREMIRIMIARVGRLLWGKFPLSSVLDSL